MRLTFILIIASILAEGSAQARDHPKRHLATITYREYEKGDVMEDEDLKRCLEKPCYVAVDSRTGKNVSSSSAKSHIIVLLLQATSGVGQK